ncbi:XRE family transcriptional regulator [Chromohalobacter japonicus]|uniref:XRE family transcriptional regulator n=1 Tax=Chromohalobacter japonicus TaxID=223900 RepID=A0A1Q8T909_9GAMM|nr:XRE family transcriptional regulator [Chromohalobacter japonicus]OLO10157.1 XRE family transcriptional regulator [Chromohalobacter japonicus]
MFNHKRLIMARKRKGLTAKSLAELAGISPVTLSRIEKALNPPDDSTVEKLSKALGYPKQFLYGEDLEDLDTDAVSFRSLSTMTAKEKHSALVAGSLGLSLLSWIDDRFNLPKPDLIDLSHEVSPEHAANALRQYWNIGVQPITNLMHLMETKGVRFLAMSENTASVDAYSFWMGGVPHVYLNNFKSAERSIFDTAHELGHLVMHCNGEAKSSREAEREANAFASSFLMPKDDVISRSPRFVNTEAVINLKARWRVSAMAMAYRLHVLKLVTEWQYKSIIIELSKRGFRKGEPVGVERERSAIWPKVLSQLWSERVTKKEIANDLALPLYEVEALIEGLVPDLNEEERNKSSYTGLRSVR